MICECCEKTVDRLSHPVFTNFRMCSWCVYLWREEGFQTVGAIRRHLNQNGNAPDEAKDLDDGRIY
jgi:hypothetical protein